MQHLPKAAQMWIYVMRLMNIMTKREIKIGLLEELGQVLEIMLTRFLRVEVMSSFTGEALQKLPGVELLHPITE